MRFGDNPAHMWQRPQYARNVTLDNLRNKDSGFLRQQTASLHTVECYPQPPAEMWESLRELLKINKVAACGRDQQQAAVVMRHDWSPPSTDTASRSIGLAHSTYEVTEGPSPRAERK